MKSKYTEACNAEEGQSIVFYKLFYNSNSSGGLVTGVVERHLNEGVNPMVEVMSDDRLVLLNPLKIVKVL